MLTLLATFGTPMASATARPTVIVRGPAGATTDVTFPRAVTFPNNGGGHSRSSNGGWSAVALVSATGPAVSRKTYLDVALPETWRCPGSSCRWTATGPPSLGDLDAHGNITLPAGRYHVVLAGDPGSTVTASLSPTGLTKSSAVKAKRFALHYMSHVTDGDRAGTQATALHAYSQVPSGGTFGLAMNVVSLALGPAAVFVDATCTTAGSDTQVTQTSGGATPCLDLQGEDFHGRGVGAATPTALAGTSAPNSAFWQAMHGASDASMGAGIDLLVTGASVVARNVFLAFQTS
jgi:hypothetical protein